MECLEKSATLFVIVHHGLVCFPIMSLSKVMILVMARQARCLTKVDGLKGLTLSLTEPVGVLPPVGSVTAPVIWLCPPDGVVPGLAVPEMTVCTGVGCTNINQLGVGLGTEMKCICISST